MPAWFKLSDYDYLKDLGASGWSSVVVSLIQVISLDRKTVTAWEAEDPEWTPQTTSEIFQDLLTESVDDRGEYLAKRFRSEPELFQFRGVSALDNSVISYMAATLSEIEHGKEAIELAKIRYEIERGKRKKYPKQRLEWIDKNRDFLRTPFFMSVRKLKGESLTENRAISVNMKLPDDALLEDFKEWLAATRALDLHSCAPRTFHWQDFERWVDGKYVPLIILKKWAEVTDTPLALHELASALFPNRPEVTQEHVRRTHWPNALKWATRETEIALSAQAAKEAGRNLPPKVSIP